MLQFDIHLCTNRMLNNLLCKGDLSCTDPQTEPTGYSPCKGRQQYNEILSTRASQVVELKQAGYNTKEGSNLKPGNYPWSYKKTSQGTETQYP